VEALKRIDAITSDVIDAAIGVHKGLGPGLLESVYELVLAGDLARRGHKIDRQVPVDIEYDGLRFPGAFRVDILVDDCVILEIKAVEALGPVHAKQLLTYLRLMNQPVGLLLNFSGETMKEGIRRMVNNYSS
jgi:iron complex transport system substrate-binding protein